MTDDELITRYVELDELHPWPGEAQLKDSGVPVWALIGYYFNAVDQKILEVAHDYDLPLVEVEAALAFYRRHKCAIDARIAENNWPSAV